MGFFMLVLSIDTSGAYVSVALNEDETVLASRFEPFARGQAEQLFPLIETLYQSAQKDISETQGIVVAVGPGSFTGVRIGLACARGLGLALDKPVWGVSHFQTVALYQEAPCVVALTTHRGDFYTQILDGNPQDAAILTQEEIKALNLPVVTDEPEAFDNSVVLLPFRQNTAPLMGLIAAQHKNFLLPPTAYYMRAADVTLKQKEA